MTIRAKFLGVLCRPSYVLAIAAVAVFAGPSSAHKEPHTAAQLKLYEDVLMEEVRKGDLLFHGDGATAKQMGVVLSNTGMACAMCHPMTSVILPQSYP